MSIMTMVMLLLLCNNFSAAQIHRQESVGLLQFSRDGSTVAYVWGVELLQPRGTEANAISQTASVRWIFVNSPNELHKVEIETWGEEANGYHPVGEIYLSFSPDSLHLAIAAPMQIVVIELKSGEHWKLTSQDEFVTSFNWLNNKEIVYVTHANRRGNHGEIVDRTCWKQDIDDTSDARQVILREKGIEGLPSFDVSNKFLYVLQDWPLEYWSPQGRYAVFTSSARFGQIRFLEVETRKITTIDSTMRIRSLAWKADQSACVCIGDECEALLIDSKNKKTVDLTQQFRRAFGEGKPPPILEPEWTLDGDFFIVNDVLKSGGCLVRPEPWEIRFIGQEVARRLNLPKDYWNLQIRRLDLPGWVQTNSTITEDYAIHYLDNKFVPLSQMSTLGPDRPVISPNGVLAASIRHDGQEFKIRKLNFAASQPITALTTRAASPPPVTSKPSAVNKQREVVLPPNFDVNARNQFDDQPLHMAVFANDKKLVELLLSKGAEVNSKGESGATPLHRAAFGGNKEIIELLIAKGARVNEKDKFEHTPLHDAAGRGWKEVVEFLIVKGADVNVKAKRGGTPLHQVAQVSIRDRGQADPKLPRDLVGVVGLLIAKGADINSKDDFGETPLHKAAQSSQKDVAEALIAKGADVNAKDHRGQTPLYEARKRDHTEIVELLLKNGAQE